MATNNLNNQITEDDILQLREAAQGGDGHSQAKLADYLYHGNCVKQDRDEAFYWEMQALEKHCGRYYSIGFPCFRNDSKLDGDWWTKEEAFELFKKYAEQGNALAQRNLGYFYCEGVCVERDDDIAFEWFKKAADQNDSQGLFQMGNYAILKDSKIAFGWYKKSAEQGFPIAMVIIAEMYFHGIGVEQNYDEARIWYIKYIKTGGHDTRVHFMIGECYSKLVGVKKYEKEAIRWYKKAARRVTEWEIHHSPKEIWQACVKLGQIYHEGIGVYPSEWLAARYYEKAGQYLMQLTDSGKDLFDIAERYYNGNGINQDYKEAVKWYRRAAKRNDVSAIRKLAEFYEKGEIVTQNKKKAMELYEQAEDIELGIW